MFKIIISIHILIFLSKFDTTRVTKTGFYNLVGTVVDSVYYKKPDKAIELSVPFDKRKSPYLKGSLPLLLKNNHYLGHSQ